jgi:hypothetical protein
LAHAVANHFAAAEFHFVSVTAALGNQVAFDLDEELRIRQANLISHGRAEHFGILAARERERHGED